MALWGKEIMMRRIAWTLAACGAIGTTWTLAQDRFPTNGGYGLNARPQASYADLLSTPDAARPFPTRDTLPRPPEATASSADLFRRDVEQSQSSSSGRPQPTQSAARIAGRASIGAGTETFGRSAESVIQAGYDHHVGQPSQIQQVRGAETSREFPSFGGGYRETAAPAAAYESFGARGEGSLLSTPISTRTGAGQSDQFARAPSTVQSSRGVTFTRSAPRPVVQPSIPDYQSEIQQASVREVAGPVIQRAAIAQDAEPDTVAIGTIGQEVRSGPQSPTVTVEWVTHSSINVGQECECELVVKNTGLIPATNVDVSAHFPTTVRLVSTEPQPLQNGSSVGWKIDELQPGDSRKIQIVLIPSEPGDLQTRADVRFSGAAATTLTVSEPLLDVQVNGPEKVLVGEPASQTVVVRNPGTGIATHVQIEAVIPAGLEHARGERLVMDVGSLNPGESRSVRLALAAATGGRHIVQVQARADGDLVRNTTNAIDVIAPSVTAEIDGPGLRYLGRNATFTLRVRNDGEIPVENVRVMHKVPEGFDVVQSDRGAQYDRPNRLVNWFVGRLEAGQAAELNVTARADAIGSFTHFIRATSDHGAIADAQFTTNVEGAPSLQLQVTDLDDPVEIGNETAYEIVVKNDGSASAKNVALVCEIPAELQVLSANGPVEWTRQRDTVAFNPVIELAPGNSVTYRVHVKGGIAGNHRLRARLTSDSAPEPLAADELTRFYGE
jgi:uncharacterized repeat protein (TIGR01451 family)